MSRAAFTLGVGTVLADQSHDTSLPLAHDRLMSLIAAKDRLPKCVTASVFRDPLLALAGLPTRIDATGFVSLGAIRGEHVARDHVVRGLGDVGRVVADALEVLGAEEEMRAEADAARVLHHVGQQLAKERGVQRVDSAVGPPHLERRGVVAVAIGRADISELIAHARRQRSKARRDLDRGGLLADGNDALGDVLGQIADALQIAGDADGRHDLAQVDGHGLARGNGKAFSSMPCCRRSMAASAAITRWASWTSPPNSAFAASRSEASARLAMSPTSSS